MATITKAIAGLAILAALISPATAANYAECILDKMPGTSNAATNAAVVQTCTQKYPTRYASIEKGSGRGFFAFKDGNACTIKKAASTSFQWAGTSIATACRCLYDLSQFKGEACGGPLD